MERQKQLRRVDAVSAALALVAALAASLLWSAPHGLAVLAGALLMWGVVRLLGRVVELGLAGALSMRLLLLAVVPLKLTGLLVAIYLAIVVAGLDPIAFTVGVSAVVTAILFGFGARRSDRGHTGESEAEG